jgi:hypothetical protein
VHPVIERDHGVGQLAIPQPAEQAAQFRAQHARVVETTEQGLDGIQHDAPGADLPDRVIETHEEALEIVFAGFLDLAAVDVDVIDEELFLLAELVEVVSQRAHVGGELLRVLLEREQHAGLAVAQRAFDEKADAEEGFARARTPGDQRGSARGESAIRDVIESWNPGRSLVYSAVIESFLRHAT